MSDDDRYEPYRWGPLPTTGFMGDLATAAGAERRAVILPISSEMLRAVQAEPSFADIWRAARNADPDEMDARAQRINTEAAARHRAVLNRCDGLTHRIAAHHAPEPVTWPRTPECTGCDLGSHPESGAAWPCSTFVMMETEVGE